MANYALGQVREGGENGGWRGFQRVEGDGPTSLRKKTPMEREKGSRKGKSIIGVLQAD